jgi:hypothetical protein
MQLEAARFPPEQLPRTHPWFRLQVAFWTRTPHRCVELPPGRAAILRSRAQQAQADRGNSRRARDIDGISRSRPLTGQNPAWPYRSEGGDVGDDRSVGACDVAADERRAMPIRQSEKAVEEAVEVVDAESAGSASESRAARGSAPIAARSLKFTASAR